MVRPALTHLNASMKMSRDFVVVDLVEFKFEGRDSAADARVETAVAQMIEHANFLDHPQRRIKRQQIDQRTEPHPFGGPSNRAEIDARRRHHVERAGVMLGDMQAIDAGLIGCLCKCQTLVEQRRQRPLAIFDMVEKSDFHDLLPPLWRAHRALTYPHRVLPSSIKCFHAGAGWAAMCSPLASVVRARHICAGMPTSPPIKVERLVKIYKQVTAVDGISFEIAPGSITGLLGGNGAGKTTTIAMIMGLITPTSGRVTVLGAEMPQQRYRVLHRMNFESPYVEMPMRLTIRQNLNVFGMLYGVRTSAIASKNWARPLT